MILAVTGHRPDKIGGYAPGLHRRLVSFAGQVLERRREEHARDHRDPITVYTGMALGWDQTVAEACTQIDMPYVAVVPHIAQPSRWPHESQIHYDGLIGEAEQVIVLFEGSWQNWMLMARNAYIVGACDEMLALWSGAPGGTASCVAMAGRARKRVTNCWEEWAR